MLEKQIGYNKKYIKKLRRSPMNTYASQPPAVNYRTSSTRLTARNFDSTRDDNATPESPKMMEEIINFTQKNKQVQEHSKFVSNAVYAAE